MVQKFFVLRCYKCSVFQVHQIKKTNKWQCKLCGEKQSVKRNYGIGTGKECRQHVQKLNMVNGEMNEAAQTVDDDIPSDDEPETQIRYKKAFKRKSKWSNFLENNDETEEKPATDDINLDDAQVVLELPAKKPRKKFNTPFKTNTLNTVTKNESYYGEQSTELAYLEVPDFQNIDLWTTNKQNDLKWATFATDNGNDNNKSATLKQAEINAYETNIKTISSKTSLAKKPNNNNNMPLNIGKKSSKWGNYVEEEQLIPEEINTNTQEENIDVVLADEKVKDSDLEPSNVGNLFSLIEDDNIDDVLNF